MAHRSLHSTFAFLGSFSILATALACSAAAEDDQASSGDKGASGGATGNDNWQAPVVQKAAIEQEGDVETADDSSQETPGVTANDSWQAPVVQK